MTLEGVGRGTVQAEKRLDLVETKQSINNHPAMGSRQPMYWLLIIFRTILGSARELLPVSWTTGQWTTGQWTTGQRTTGQWTTGQWTTGQWTTGVGSAWFSGRYFGLFPAGLEAVRVPRGPVPRSPVPRSPVPVRESLYSIGTGCREINIPLAGWIYVDPPWERFTWERFFSARYRLQTRPVRPRPDGG